MLCTLAFYFATDQDDNVEEFSEALRVTPEWKKKVYIGECLLFFFPFWRSLRMSHTIFERYVLGVKKANFVVFFLNIKLQQRIFYLPFSMFHEITVINKYIF